MAEHYLGRTVLASVCKLPITPEQYQDIDDAITSQWEAMYLEQKYDFVLENYLELEETILRCGLEYMVLGRQDRKSFNVDTALFNRRIMNLLTTFKTYEDSCLQHFNKIFHRDPLVVDAAMAPFRKEYDSRIGYRTMAKLRNFIQHQGFPVHGSSYCSKWIPDGSEAKARNRYTIELYLTSAELRKGDFNTIHPS